MTHVVSTIRWGPGDELRPDMEYGEPYVFEPSMPDAEPCRCQPESHAHTCSAPGCSNTDWLITIKHPHAGQPLGHLYARCPEHQARYEATRQ